MIEDRVIGMIQLEEMLECSRSLLCRGFYGMHRNWRKADLRDIVAMDGESRLEKRHCDFNSSFSFSEIS